MTDNVPPEIMRELIKIANLLAWKKPDLNVLQPQFAEQYSALSQVLQTHLKKSNKRGRLILPDLRALENESVAIFSDYGGESVGKYHTYSVLVCGWNMTGPFISKMKDIRTLHHLGTKEISFKDFRMGQIRRALPDYLNALDNLLPGFLLTLAVDKRLVSLFGPQEKATHAQLAELLKSAGLGDRKPHIAEKLIRIVHLTAFLCGLLAHDGQKIFWMTDHDAICANEELHQKTLELFARVLTIYTRKGCSFSLIGGGSPFQERDVDTLDLLSIADVVAGALDQYLSQVDNVAPEHIKFKPGCEQVLQWLGHDGVGLKKMNILVRPGRDGGIEGVTLEIGLKTPPPGTKIVPIWV